LQLLVNFHPPLSVLGQFLSELLFVFVTGMSVVLNVRAEFLILRRKVLLTGQNLSKAFIFLLISQKPTRFVRDIPLGISPARELEDSPRLLGLAIPAPFRGHFECLRTDSCPPMLPWIGNWQGVIYCKNSRNFTHVPQPSIAPSVF
jgi:hypothetical protein